MLPLLIHSPSRVIDISSIDEITELKNINKKYLIKIFPIETRITIEQIRELRKDVRVVSKTDRLIVIETFDSATAEAQNAMLKMLEESSLSNQFVLLVQNLEFVLPTIRSRCKIIKIYDKTKEPNISSTEFDRIADLLCDSPATSLFTLPQLQSKDRSSAVSTLYTLLKSLRKRVVKKDAKALKLTKKIFEILPQLQFSNMNHQLAIDALICQALKQ